MGWPWSEDSKRRTIKKLEASVSRHVKTINKLEKGIEKDNIRIQELEEQLKQLQAELESRPTPDSYRQLGSKVGELESQLSSSKDQFGIQLETLQKELSKEMNSKSELESFIRRMLKTYLPIGGKYEEYVCFVPKENIGYSALIEFADLSATDPYLYRDFIHLERKFWWLHLERITPDVKELVIAGLPVEDQETLSSVQCKVVVVSYDARKIEAGKLTVVTPRQYLEERNGKDSPIYHRIDLLTQLIDGRNVKAPQDVIEEARLLAEKSVHLSHDDLTELRHGLRKYGTIKNPELRRQLTELYLG